MLFPEYHLSTESFVHAATTLYVLGFLCRDQILLRAVVLTGTCFYLAYYWFHETGPLWDPLIGSLLIGSANLRGLISLIHSRMDFTISREARPLYAALGLNEPGLFRALMRAGELRTGGGRLTDEGRTPDHLYFVLSGRPTIVKNGQRFAIPSGCFIGEVSWLLGVPASATAELPETGSCIAWPRKNLDRLVRRRPRVKQALEALIAADMARKVAASSANAAAAA